MTFLKLFKQRWSMMVGALIVVALIFIAIFGPSLVSYKPDQMDMSNRFSEPTTTHWLGTDNFGRDLWTRTAHGARLSLFIALISVGISSLFGTWVGLSAGYFGGWFDLLVMRVVDIFLGFPIIILALALIAVLGPGPINVIIALIAVFWTQYARVARSIALAEREQEYVKAAQVLGASNIRIIARHILPNSLGPILVLATLGLGTAIIAESALSFLGFGVQPPEPSWGWTLSYGMRVLRNAPHLSMVPGIAIMITVLGFNLMGDGLRDHLDPRGVTK